MGFGISIITSNNKVILDTQSTLTFVIGTFSITTASGATSFTVDEKIEPFVYIAPAPASMDAWLSTALGTRLLAAINTTYAALKVSVTWSGVNIFPVTVVLMGRYL